MIVYRFIPSHFPVRATEWMLAAMKASFGLLLLLREDIFLAPETAPLFTGFRAIFPQMTWALIGSLAGCFHLAALYINGTWRRSPHVRGFCSGVGTVFWSLVVYGLVSGGVWNTGLAIYPWFVVFSVYNLTRAMQDASLSDDRARGGLIGGSR